MNKNILAIKEQLKDNLSSNQISQILDKFLYSALQPIVFYSNYAESFLINIIYQIYNDHRRKFSILTKEELINNIYITIASEDKNIKWKYILNMRLERTIWQNVVYSFIEKCKNYDLYERKYINSKNKIKWNNKLCEIENNVKVDRKYLSIVISQSKYNINMFRKFKHMIIEKYLRMAYIESIKDAKATSLQIDTDSLYANYILAIDKAIDKYDNTKGTLTSYIQYWLKDALSNPKYDHQYGKSYDISPNSQRKLAKNYGNSNNTNLLTYVEDNELNNSLSDENTAELNLINEINRQELISIINKVKGTKIIKIIHNIPYNFNNEEKELLYKMRV